MQPGLVGKGRGADIRRAAQGHAVQDVVEHAARLRHPLQRVHRDAGVEPAGIGFLQEQRRDQAGEVGIAAAFAKPVQRALDLARARGDGGERIGDAKPRVVMGVDADMVARHARRDHGAGGGLNVGRQGAAIGVAEDNPAGARVIGRLAAGGGVIRVGLPAVEEMFGIEKRLAPLRDDMGDGGGDVVEVFVERDAEGGGDVEVMRLADEADGGGSGVQDRGEDVVIIGRPPGALGHAEGGEGGAGLGPGREKVAVGRVGAGPAALDIVDADPVERMGDLHLVGDGELHALRLLAVAKGRVVEVEAFTGHSAPPFRARRLSVGARSRIRSGTGAARLPATPRPAPIAPRPPRRGLCFSGRRSRIGSGTSVATALPGSPANRFAPDPPPRAGAKSPPPSGRGRTSVVKRNGWRVISGPPVWRGRHSSSVKSQRQP